MFVAALFIVVTLTGFIPDSLEEVAAVKAGERPPFPIVLHFHAVLMGSFRCALRQVLGRVSVVLVPVLVPAGLILVPTTYRGLWFEAQSVVPLARVELQALLLNVDNVMLMQLRIALLFLLFIFIGLRARRIDAGVHKRMMILATAMPAAIDRILWLPTTFPANPLASDLYTLALVSPMFLWDVIRNRTVHRAYLIWLGVNLVAAALLYTLWGTGWWYATAPHLVGL